MKSFFAILFIIIFTSTSWSQESTNYNPTTTYYFIRHAEKDRSDKANRNPDLNKLGQKRAKKWAKYFKKVDFGAVYSTNYNRTQQTAQPTANKQKLEILAYDPKNLYSEQFKKSTLGKTVLVVGHSNTTPAFVNAILGEKKYDDIDDNDNSKLFIVTVSEEKIIDKIITVN